MFPRFPLAIDVYVDQFMNFGNTIFIKFNRIGVHWSYPLSYYY